MDFNFLKKKKQFNFNTVKPNMNIPKFNTVKPNMNIPKFNTVKPNMNIPKFNTVKPNMNIPKFNTVKPNMNIPKFNTVKPNMNIPKFNTVKPNMNIPKFNTVKPNMNIPKFNTVKPNIPKGYNINTSRQQFMKSNPSRKLQFMDSDGDGYINRIDCYPFDSKRQGEVPNIQMVNIINQLPILISPKSRFTSEEKYQSQSISTLRFPNKYKVYKIGSKNIDKRFNNLIYGVFKKHPHLISEIQNLNVRILFTIVDDYKDYYSKAFTIPIQVDKNDNIIKSGIAFSLPDDPMNEERNKNIIAEMLFHELRHVKQNTGKNINRFDNTSNYTAKEYYQSPEEKDAYNYQIKKISERFPGKYSKYREDLQNLQEELDIKYDEGKFSLEDARKIKEEFKQRYKNE